MTATLTPQLPATNWAGNVDFGAARSHRPETVDELRRLVAGATRVRALGSGHSFSPVAATDGDLVSVAGLPRVLEVDPVARTVTVGAGMRFTELVYELNRAGFALANLASLPHISVAGSVATGTHGSGDANRCLSASVAGLRLVDASGELVDLDRDSSGFTGSVVALGALGVVTRVTLDIEPTYSMTQRVRLGVCLDEVTDQLDAVFGSAYSVSVFTDFRGPCQVWQKDRTDRPITGWAGGRPADRPVHPVPGMPPHTSTEQLGVRGPWHERLPHFRPDLVPGAGAELQSEYYLPRAAAPAALRALRAMAGRIAPVIHIAELRSVRADQLWLSPAYGRDTVTVHFTWLDDLAAVRPVMAAVEQRLTPLGARPHWGKLTTATPAELAARYPRFADFRALVAEHDPDGVFGNPFVDALLGRG